MSERLVSCIAVWAVSYMTTAKISIINCTDFNIIREMTWMWWRDETVVLTELWYKIHCRIHKTYCLHFPAICGSIFVFFSSYFPFMVVILNKHCLSFFLRTQTSCLNELRIKNRVPFLHSVWATSEFAQCKRGIQTHVSGQLYIKETDHEKNFYSPFTTEYHLIEPIKYWCFLILSGMSFSSFISSLFLIMQFRHIY